MSKQSKQKPTNNRRVLPLFCGRSPLLIPSLTPSPSFTSSLIHSLPLSLSSFLSLFSVYSSFLTCSSPFDPFLSFPWDLYQRDSPFFQTTRGVFAIKSRRLGQFCAIFGPVFYFPACFRRQCQTNCPVHSLLFVDNYGADYFGRQHWWPLEVDKK